MRQTPSPLWTFTAVLVCGLLFGSADRASAQAFISPIVGYDFGGDAGCPELTDCDDKKLNAGVAVGVMGPFLGFEEELAYAKDFFGDAPGLSSSVLTLMSNVMVSPAIGPIRPYVLAGVGLIKTHVELTPTDVFTTTNNNFGWDVGGGLMVFLAPHVAVRGDVRYFHAFQDFSVLGVGIDNETLDFGRAAAGLVLSF
jgi:opacity protein-like surface antigen